MKRRNERFLSLSLSLARVLSFLFLSPTKRRGESRKTGRSDLDKKKQEEEEEEEERKKMTAVAPWPKAE